MKTFMKRSTILGWDILKEEKWKLIILFLEGILLSFISTISAYLYMLLINNISEQVNVFMRYLGLFLLAHIIINSLNIYIMYYSKKIKIELQKRMQDKIVKCMLNKDGEYLSNCNTSDLFTILISDSMKVMDFTFDILFRTLVFFIKGIGILIFLLTVRWELVLVVLIIQPLIIMIEKKIKNINKRFAEKYRLFIGQYYSTIKEFTTRIIDILSLGISDYVYNKYKKSQVDYMNSELKMTVMAETNSSVIEISTILSIGAIMLIGSREINSGAFTIGGLLLFVQYSGQLFSPFKAIYNAIYSYSSVTPSITRIKSFCKDDDKEMGLVTDKLHGNLSLHNISFSYNNDREVFHNASAEFRSNSTYVICGESGCGKSTLCKLLLQFWKIQNGNIYIDNIDITKYNKEFLRKNITYISQDCFLFNDTIYNNIVLDNQEVTKEQFWNAVKKAGLYDTIQQLNEKENSFVGDQGVKFSGGQKQRIVIARAIIRNTPIIILDEPTSALDSQNEIHVMKNMMDCFNNKTLIIISHKPDVISRCDIKYLINQKKIEIA